MAAKGSVKARLVTTDAPTAMVSTSVAGTVPDLSVSGSERSERGGFWVDLAIVMVMALLSGGATAWLLR